MSAVISPCSVGILFKLLSVFPSLTENTNLESLLLHQSLQIGSLTNITREAHVRAMPSQMLDICRHLPVSIQQVQMVVDGTLQSLFHSRYKDVWQKMDDILSSPNLKHLQQFTINSRGDSGADLRDVERILHKFAAKTCKRGVVQWWSDYGESE